MILKDIIDIIESVAPRGKQEAWDNSGLQVGNTSADIQAVLLTTDVTESVVNEAIENGCNLIISHHPLLFHGLKQVCGQTPQARCVEQAIRHNIAIYSAHTSMDKYLHGVSGRMAEKMRITDYSILCPDGFCSSPADEAYGLGVVGDLPEALSPETFLQKLKEAFGAPWLRYTRSPKDTIRRVAFCGGAGSEFAAAAVQSGADAFVTADVKYHEFQEFDGQIMLVDMDHWVSEHFTRDIFRELLDGKVKTIIAESDLSPVSLG